MRDLQLLIENIQTAILFPDTISPTLLRQYARDYAEACIELNRQLQNCIVHIRNGNNSEATRLSELERPSIPEKFLMLDFAARKEWIEIIISHGLQVPPVLFTEQLKELDAAYLRVSPLEPFLKTHRLQALNNSPLKERLITLRTIAKIDSQNLFWQEDQEKFEKARIEEINKEIQDAILSNNITLIDSLQQELNSPNWIIQPPTQYRQMICTCLLQNYADTLLKHFADFNYPQSANVYALIQQTLVANAASMPINIQNIIRPAIAWINKVQKQNELDKQVKQQSLKLQRALESESPKPILERLYYELNTIVSQAGLKISEELDEFYHSKIDEIESHKSQFVKIIVVAIIGLCVLIGSLIMWGLTAKNNKQKINDVITKSQQIKDSINQVKQQ